MIARMGNSEVKNDVLKDEVSWVALFQDFSINLIDYVNSQKDYQDKKELKEFFASPGVFDGLVNVLILELTKSPIRPHIADP